MAIFRLSIGYHFVGAFFFEMRPIRYRISLFFTPAKSTSAILKKKHFRPEDALGEGGQLALDRTHNEASARCRRPEEGSALGLRHSENLRDGHPFASDA